MDDEDDEDIADDDEEDDLDKILVKEIFQINFNKKKITIIRIINQQVEEKKKKKKNQDFKFEKKTLISFGRLGKFSRDYN